MTRNTPRHTPRTARHALRMVLLAAAMGAAYACGSDPTGPASAPSNASHDDNSGYMGSGYGAVKPDTTTPPKP
jgi:hypothetical protein